MAMSLRILRRVVPATLLLALPSLVRCDVTDLHGEYLTINSKNVSVSFKGAEVVRIANQITGELYFNNVVKLPPLMEMPMVTGEKGELKCTTWRLGRANDQGFIN